MTISNLPPGGSLTVLGSLNQALHELMDAEKDVFLLGEDILDPYGGAFNVCQGLSSRFPERVLTTPISEAAIVGVAVGMALRGMRPIAEIMFGDFLALAADQLINHAAKFKWMYNGKRSVPLVVRTPMGGRRGYGPTHSQSLEKHFMGVPGLWLLAPHYMGDPGLLLKKAVLECDDPVLFIESKTCYSKVLSGPPEDMVAHVYTTEDEPFPTIRLCHADAKDGPEAILLCYGGMLGLCLEAVQNLKAREELLIDLVVPTQLSPVPAAHLRIILDEYCPSTIAYAEEASLSFGWSAEMVARIEEMKEDLETAPEISHCRIGASDSVIAASRNLENRILPQAEDVFEALLNCF